MRETKFRAYYPNQVKNSSFIYTDKIMPWIGAERDTDGAFLSLNFYGWAIGHNGDYHDWPIGDENVSQFTGLILKGKEVYADDIISFPDTESEYVDVGVGDMKVAETNVRGWGEVVFKNYSWGLEIIVSCESIEKGFTSFAELLDIFEEQDLEIIGNKFEHSELLK